MGCGASVPVQHNVTVVSPTKPTNVEAFNETTTDTSEEAFETPGETSIDWEWKASGTRLDRSLEGQSQKFKEEDVCRQLARSKSNVRSAGEHLEPIIELEDFDDGEFSNHLKAKVAPAVCVEADEASSCATPRI